ncbi:MAG: sporulation integral membrane protein YtvI [Oscillospiraceae bacterium]|nr:sporulation integral membrane protein YtvI [Oscillospiraceae bacterium]
MRDRSVYARLLIKFSAFCICATLAVLFLKSAIKMFAPFLLALLFAMTLHPAVGFVMKKFKLRHTASSALCVAAVFVIIGGFLTWIVSTLLSELLNFALNWANIWGNVNKFLDGLFDSGAGILEHLPGSIGARLQGLTATLSDGVYSAVSLATQGLEDMIGSLKKSLPSVVLFTFTFVITSFMISGRFPRLRRWYLEKTSDDPENPLAALVLIVKSAFGGYLRATLIIAAVVGAVTLAAFLILRVKYAFLLAVLMAILDILPYVGAGIVIFPWAVISVVQGSIGRAAILIVTYGAILVIRNFFLPKILGSQAGVSPLVTLTGVFLGFSAGGIWGMIWGPIVVIILAGIFRSGIFGGTIADIKALARDIRIKLDGT